MSTALNSTRQRIVDAALALFGQQGLTETTTKQIAESAEVNEVTLFRQFGNKQGVLLAVVAESGIFERLAHRLGASIDVVQSEMGTPADGIQGYARAYLELCGSNPALLRSLVGESGNYSAETKEVLGLGIQKLSQQLTQYWGRGSANPDFERRWQLFNAALLGYAILEVMTESYPLGTCQDAFIQDLVQVVLNQTTEGAIAPPEHSVMDLPASLVHRLFQRAQKQGHREWALIYLLFGAGVSPFEITQLERVHHLCDRNSQVLQIMQGAIRQVPVNQWIMGKRYGTYQKNPLTQWLKSRKDDQAALLLGADAAPITEADIQAIWQQLTQGLVTLEGRPPGIEQAQHTWCIDMLLRGMSVENMQVLTGLSTHQLAPYCQRAKEKAVLEQGLSLDRQQS